MSESMTFRLSTKESGISINAFPLLTHSQRIYGTLVETYGPYPRDYMSECRYSKWYVPILLRESKFVNGGSWKKRGPWGRFSWSIKPREPSLWFLREKVSERCSHRHFGIESVKKCL